MGDMTWWFSCELTEDSPRFEWSKGVSGGWWANDMPLSDRTTSPVRNVRL